MKTIKNHFKPLAEGRRKMDPDAYHDYCMYSVAEEKLMKRYEENKERVLDHVLNIVRCNEQMHGQWSMDIMQNGNDFWFIDMATANESALKEWIGETMKIIYSKYTFEEVHNTRRKWLSDEPGTSHEEIKIVLRSFPFLVYFLFCEYILLKYTLLINIFDYSQPLAYRNVMRKIMNLDIYKSAGVYTKFSIDILSYICYMSAIGIALYLIAILIRKIYKNIVCRFIPISTPCIDRNKKKRYWYDKTIDIEESFERQKTLKEFISDHNATFTLTGNVLKVTICGDGYCEEKSFQLSKIEAKEIREKGKLDFSYLDEEWGKILLYIRGEKKYEQSNT